MQLMHFHVLRSGVQTNAAPAQGPALTAMEGILRDALVASGLFDSVEVGHTDDPDQLVIGLCSYRHLLHEQVVADRVTQLWTDRIAYPFWEIHAVVVDDGHVEIEGATRESAAGHYVTLHVVAQRSPVPTQRSGEDAAPDRLASYG